MGVNQATANPEMRRTRQERNADIDYCRGIAIVFVVLTHVVRGIHGASMITDGSAWMRAILVITSLVIPVFFFLAGGFARRTPTWGEQRAFLIGKGKTVLYPYFVWSMIMLLFKSVMGAHQEGLDPLVLLLALPVVPYDIYWFLHTLMFCFLVHALTGRMDDRFFLILGSALYMVDYLSHLFYPVHLLARYLVFFALGRVLLHKVRHLIQEVSPSARAGVGLLVALFLALNILRLDDALPFFDFDLNNSLWALPHALAGILALLMISSALAKTKMLAMIEAFGKLSLYVYVSHTFFTAGTRIFLRSVGGIEWIPLHVAAGLTAGLVGPLLVIWLAKKMGTMWLFSLKPAYQCAQ